MSQKQHQSYSIKISDDPFDNGLFSLPRTAVIIFRDGNRNVVKKERYGVLDVDEVYEKIVAGDVLNISNCYIKNFSLAECREKHALSKDEKLQLNQFSAIHTFFEADTTTDFSYAEFANNCDFINTTFGSGNVSFYKTDFKGVTVDFSNVDFGEGSINFQFADFGTGDVIFENGANYNGNTSFINANFGDGNVNFKNFNFGLGNVDFHFAKFGTGDISFDKSEFNGKYVDFRKVEFGEGKLDFRKTTFGNALVSFEEIEHKKGRTYFKRATFGSGNISFDMADFGNEEVSFEAAEFGTGSLSMLRTISKSITFKSCQLKTYIDLRVSRCECIDLSDTIIRDIIDLKKGKTELELNTLILTGVRNLGKIFLDWKENKVKTLIESQNSTDLDKSNQFRLLKEDFHSSGKYNDEDKAYVAFKRYELKAYNSSKINSNGFNRLWVYPVSFGKKLIFDWMGLYATNPLRVLISMLCTYVLFSITYLCMIHWGIGDLKPGFSPPEELSEMAISFYHSAITFLTIGYGDYSPWGSIRMVSSIEGFVGLFLMSYFTVAFVRKILR
ncbi:MAG: potassium channel family protein [Flavobacteriales bacterium]|nr:potassium channel family protein [Flavobacteriales bacterium]